MNDVDSLKQQIIESGAFRSNGQLNNRWLKNKSFNFDLSCIPGFTINEKLYVLFKNNGVQNKCNVCGKPAKFKNYAKGYFKTCSYECKKKNEEKVLKRNIFLGINHTPEAEAKKLETFQRNFGANNPMQSKEVQLKVKRTSMGKYGTEYPQQTEIIKNKTKATNLKKYGVEYSTQAPEIKRKILSNKGKTKPEIEFEEFLKENNYVYQYEVDYNDKNFDFAIFKEEKLDILIEIDGEYYHGLTSDCDFNHVRGDKDYLRFSKVPPRVKYIVCDSERVKEIENIFPEIYNQTYKEWLESLKFQIPSNFPYYDFSERRLRLDYKHLCEYKIYKLAAQIGTSSVLYFCKSLFFIFKNNLPSMTEAWQDKELINRLIDERYLYYSEFSSHSILDGFKDCPYVYRKEIISPSLIRYIIKKYVEGNSIFDPNSSPSILLATSSLGKNYTTVCKDSVLKNELEEMVEFHSIETVNFIDSINEVSTLIAEIEDEKEIDSIVNSYNAKKYLFLINKESDQATEIFSTDLDDKNKNLSIIIIDGRS